ncbi:glycosyltransferase [Paractinoplanes atraurantiacus]|uniref:4,4'-diaponeurosporenoate glycosyltransferase n=1 Tax=Paractinoplanes atraurantiacus TaxID=1036182 RepID=A0A285K273_9ACTN|nr:glycosyltransferase [Actinoplanes atraurantiacus]SNY66665.1 Glycosyl transferase family 2 [Actinoplanes atraurantiacus]
MNRIAVIVPAHNEESLLPGCLNALGSCPSPVPVEIIVAADSCTDDTAALAAKAGAHVVATNARNVGQARAAGAAYAMRAGTGGLWLATTDADSRVPAQWLQWQLAHARAGADLLMGTVAVDDWLRWPEALRAVYEARYRRAGQPHVHGANLGFSATAYVSVGGFPPLPYDEDRALIGRFRAAGAHVVADGGCPVSTSSRPVARAPHGFSAHLAALAAGLRTT